MVLMAKTTTNSLWVSPFYHHRREVSIRYHNGILSFKESSRTCTKIRASGLLNQTINQPITGYDAQIRKFCEVGNLKMAMDLLCKAHKIELVLETYCSILELCADSRSLHDGRKVHSIIDSIGIEIDDILGSKLVFMYLKCGDLREGRRVFDKVAIERAFIWNLLINEYAKNGDFEEGIVLYGRMIELGVEANSYTLTCVLKCITAEGSVAEGEQVHGQLLRLGFGSYTAVANSLIAFYFKSGRTDSARKLFDELSDRDVITWNSMISGYVVNNFVEKGVNVFLGMLESGISVDLATIVILLAACANVGIVSLGRAIHGYAMKAGFNKEINYNNTLLDMYSKCGDISGATQVFRNMGERSVVSWTSMIAGYTREGLSDKAIALFYEMEKEGIKPDSFTVASILNACTRSGSLDNGKEIHNYIREKNMHLSLSVSNALMDMYAKCGSMEDANSVFSQMPIKDIVSWNTMIGGNSKNSLPNEALNLFVEMQNELKPDNMTLTCVLPSCASLGALDRGREIHGHILRNGLSVDRYIANALVDMYVKCGALVLAQSLFDTIHEKDLVSWTVMVAGYCMHGFGSEAIAAFNEMRKTGIEPTEVSFISILFACSHSGLHVEARKFFHIMRNDCNLEPKMEHYACMVDLLARLGKFSKAYRFVERMPIEPDATVWGALLSGCRIHHDVKLAEKVSEHVFELEPDNTRYYVLLANIYAEAEKWEEMKKLRDKIGRKGLKKNPGCSWIEVKGKFHVFVAGYNSYPQAKKIESLLKNLRMKMKEEDCFPKLRYALINEDDAEREEALCGHSEKLAMAFGILSLPCGKTIRVTKNRRTCGDCHEMARFVSNRVGREIVLRDSSRFHHFKDGSCSCRGYW